jgi:hypothetical protein
MKVWKVFAVTGLAVAAATCVAVVRDARVQGRLSPGQSPDPLGPGPAATSDGDGAELSERPKPASVAAFTPVPAPSSQPDGRRAVPRRRWAPEGVASLRRRIPRDRGGRKAP